MLGDLLRAEAITVRFGGVQALSDVGLAVAEGQIMGLIGPNGAGKTTLFQAVGGYLRPDGGRILFNGDDVTSWPAHRRATAGIGRTFQRLELFGHLTVAENLLVAAETRESGTRLRHDVFALPVAARAERRLQSRVEDVLELTGLAWAADREALTLPMGAGRMLEIGRALCAEPSLLLLDEPSSGLDHRESGMLAELIRRVHSERSLAILLVEHDVAFVADLCERIAVLDFGSIIAEGTPAEVLASEAVRAAYLGGEAS